MTVHDDIESMVDVYLAGGLDDAERRDVEEHAASCDACARTLRDAKNFHGWMKGTSAPGAPPTGLEERIIANLRSATFRRSHWPRGMRWFAGMAAVFALVIVGGFFTGSKEERGLLQRMTVSKNPAELRTDGYYTEGATQERGPAFTRHHTESDGYAGDTTVEGEVVRGWGYEASGFLALPTEAGKKHKEEFKREMERDSRSLYGATSQSPPADKDKNGEFFSRGIGGGGGSRGPAGGRMLDSRLKNLAEDKAPAPAPATAAPMTDAAPAEHPAEIESLDLEKRKAGEELRNEPDGRPDAPPVVDDRKIIRNADLHLEVVEYEKAYKAIGDITRAKKGFIAGASTTKLANGKIRATVTLRIPPEKFEETLAELGQLGLVRHQAISTSDVTKQYQDLASRLKSKETLVERLKKVLLEGKGTVKELMEVEVQMGATIEQIESIKGELKYYDNLVGLSTITMQVFEKDMGLPFEYVQTLQSVIAVTDFDADARYEAAQKVILDAGGQVAESRMTRANNDSASGFVRGKVDADKFPAVRDALKKLGRVDQDTVNQQQTGRGGQGDAKPGAPVRKEQAVIDFTVNTPPIVTTRRAMIAVEASPAETAYQQARREVEAAKGEILGGSMTDKTGGAAAFVRARVDAKDFPGLVEKLKGLGKVKSATVKQDEPGVESGEPPLLREKGEVLIEIATPAPLIPEESGLGRVLRDTFSRSVAGVLWSVEKLFVGIALAGPWIVLAIVVILVWRRARRSKQTSA
ncbi:MAG TPA: DUF4349 domain-containing protein [Planctomycetota bacterium]|nr:DUF4349 domain-containing protein [Planctomycetota bacterium]